MTQPAAASHAAARPHDARTGEVVLEVRGLTRRFGAVVALDGVDLALHRGEVHALCGENGAGKSTLIKTLCGLHAHGSYGGTVLIDGREHRFAGVRDAEAAGIAVIHQELALVPQMSVAANLFLGCEPRRFGLIDHERMHAEAGRLLARHGIDVPAAAIVGELGVGQRQLVEIARALRRDSRVLVLDEPSAALTGREVATLLDIVRGLAARGVACLYVSHKLEEVFAIADRITVLRDGRSIVTTDAHSSSRAQIIAHMVGRRIEDLYPVRREAAGAALLAVEGLAVAARAGMAARLHDISFTLRAGEILGIGGLMGAGRSELLMHLFGAWGHRLAGRVRLGAAELAISPRACIAQGLVLITEDRKRYGLVLQQTVGFNLSLSSIAQFCRRGVLRRDAEFAANEAAIHRLRIRAGGQETVTATLSGGNQQKVMIGKALMTAPKVVLLDEPTRGIDVGARQEIYELIAALKAEGLAVLLVSSELPELMGLSDRILMLADGTVGGEFAGGTATQEALLAAAMAGPPRRAPGAAHSSGETA